MTNRHKIEERHHLDRFRTLYPSFPHGMVRASESPDFVVESADHQTTGIELVYYIHGQGGLGGSSRQRDEDFHREFELAARKEYESFHGAPLWVNFWWTTSHTPDKRLVRRLARIAAVLVAQHVPPSSPGEKRIAWENIHNSPLENILTDIDIHRHPGITENLWTSPESGFISVDPDDIQRLIDSKRAKLQVYRQSCDKVWLLIVARGGHSIANTASLNEGIRGHAFRSDFDRVVFYDVAHEQVVALLKADEIRG